MFYAQPERKKREREREREREGNFIIMSCQRGVGGKRWGVGVGGHRERGREVGIIAGDSVICCHVTSVARRELC